METGGGVAHPRRIGLGGVGEQDEVQGHVEDRDGESEYGQHHQALHTTEEQGGDCCQYAEDGEGCLPAAHIGNQGVEETADRHPDADDGHGGEAFLDREAEHLEQLGGPGGQQEAGRGDADEQQHDQQGPTDIFPREHAGQHFHDRDFGLNGFGGLGEVDILAGQVGDDFLGLLDAAVGHQPAR